MSGNAQINGMHAHRIQKSVSSTFVSNVEFCMRQNNSICMTLHDAHVVLNSELNKFKDTPDRKFEANFRVLSWSFQRGQARPKQTFLKQYF